MSALSVGLADDSGLQAGRVDVDADVGGSTLQRARGPHTDEPAAAEATVDGGTLF